MYQSNTGLLNNLWKGISQNVEGSIIDLIIVSFKFIMINKFSESFKIILLRSLKFGPYNVLTSTYTIIMSTNVKLSLQMGVILFQY